MKQVRHVVWRHYFLVVCLWGVLACGGGQDSGGQAETQVTQTGEQNAEKQAQPQDESAQPRQPSHGAVSTSTAVDLPSDPALASPPMSSASEPPPTTLDLEAPIAAAPDAVSASGMVPDPAVSNGLAGIKMGGSCLKSTTADFISDMPSIVVRLWPLDCAIVKDNPVTFSWPWGYDYRGSGAKQWRLKVLDSRGTAYFDQSVNTLQKTLDRTLPVGYYTWSVSYTNNAGKLINSRPRQFYVPALPDSTIATVTQLMQRFAAQKARDATLPRVLPATQNFASIAASLSRVDSEFKNDFSGLIAKVNSSLTAVPPAHPASQPTDLSVLRNLTLNEFSNIEDAGFAWRLTNNAQYLSKAKERLLNLANWPARGANAWTSEVNHTQANRAILLALAVGYDLLSGQLSAAEQKQVQNALSARVTDSMGTIDQLQANPYHGFANTAIHYLNTSLLLVAGRPGFEWAQAPLEKIWPLCWAQFQTFASYDGGYDGSMAYAWYDLPIMARNLATTKLLTNMDPAQRAYIQHMGDFFIATTPINRDHMNSFGDGAEVKNLYQSYSRDAFRLYASVTDQPTHHWYWQQSTSTDLAMPLNFMMAAKNNMAQTVATAPRQNDFVFPDVGIVAMHNHGAASDRSSVLFRSSRFGSYDHDHADQNAYTVTLDGIDLLINSGYYASFNTPHHMQVTRATRYKNAVTFDGGLGQAERIRPQGPAFQTMEAYGQLTQAWLGDKVSVATGDATMAYRQFDTSSLNPTPLLNGAYRSVAYFKNEGVIAVYDWLSSNTPRSWEWNYHGLQAFNLSADKEVIYAQNGTARACIIHRGMVGSAQLNNAFDVLPDRSTDPPQSHARFTSKTKSTKAVVVTLIIQNCSITPKVVFGTDGDQAEVTVGKRLVRMNKLASSVWALS